MLFDLRSLNAGGSRVEIPPGRAVPLVDPPRPFEVAPPGPAPTIEVLHASLRALRCTLQDEPGTHPIVGGGRWSLGAESLDTMEGYWGPRGEVVGLPPPEREDEVPPLLALGDAAPSGGAQPTPVALAPHDH